MPRKQAKNSSSPSSDSKESSMFPLSRVFPSVGYAHIECGVRQLEPHYLHGTFPLLALQLWITSRGLRPSQVLQVEGRNNPSACISKTAC